MITFAGICDPSSGGTLQFNRGVLAVGGNSDVKGKHF